ncbi:Piwi domain-containing protein [Abortiporus biennis]|nr:Piwi domain-containing protein [Abortiporus biennis]
MAAMEQSTDVIANMFPITSLPKKTFHQYDGVIRPELKIPNTRRSNEIITKLQISYPQYFTPRGVYDGKAILYSINDLGASITLSVNMSNTPKPGSEKGVFKVTFTKVASIDPNAIKRLLLTPLNHTSATFRQDRNVINLIQLIVRQGANLRHHFPEQARAFYHNKNARDLTRGLIAFHGIFQSVRPVQGRLLVNIDSTNAAFYQEGPLLSLAMAFLQIRNARDVERISPAEAAKLQSFLKKVKVTPDPNYLGGGHRQRAKAITSVVPRAGFYSFPKDGVPTTVADYFRDKYNYQLRYPGIFGVLVGKDAVYPAELCLVPPGQIYRRKLDSDQQAKMIDFAKMKPDQRLRTIKDAVSGQHQLLDYENSDFMIDAGIQVDKNPMTIRASILKVPTIHYFGQQTARVSNGGWNVKDMSFIRPTPITRFSIVDFVGQSQVTSRFVQNLCQNLHKLGIYNIAGRPAEFQPGYTLGNTNRVSESILKGMTEGVWWDDKKIRRKPTFILVILPTNAAAIRREVKYVGNVKEPVPIQCVREGKYERANDQYCNNVALKIHAKIGGVNSHVQSPAMGMLKNAMVIGCDVSHPAPGVFNKPSIASMVSSYDRKATRYRIQGAVQLPRQEIIQDLEQFMKTAINDFGNAKRMEKEEPKLDQVIVYRDGVSEGEFIGVAGKEVEVIKRVLQEFSEVYHQPVPKLVFIVVTKRHHVRFFPVSPNAGDRSGNCPPGLVVDDEIVYSSLPDFYLQSHGGILGTSRSSHYVVLCNETPWTMRQLQHLSYALCHSYAAATRSVSIPAPVYYADRVCASAEFHMPPNMNLEETGSTTDGGNNFDLESWRKEVTFDKELKRQLYFL